MAYEAKPGSFSLFKNDRKEKDTHPDYKGDGKDLDGNPVWVLAWLKDGSKGKFMSCTLELKKQQSAAPTRQAPPPRKALALDDDGAIPF